MLRPGAARAQAYESGKKRIGCLWTGLWQAILFVCSFPISARRTGRHLFGGWIPGIQVLSANCSLLVFIL